MSRAVALLLNLVLLPVAGFSLAVFAAFYMQGEQAISGGLNAMFTDAGRWPHVVPMAAACATLLLLLVSTFLRFARPDVDRGRVSATALLLFACVPAALLNQQPSTRVLWAGMAVGAAFALLLAATTLAATTPAGRQTSSPSPGRRGNFWLALALGAATTVFHGFYALQRHAAHWSSQIDLGLFYELFDNAQNKLLISPTLGMSFLGEHFSPILVLLAPVMWLFPSPETLLVIQACSVGVAASLLFAYTIDRTGHRGLAIAFAVVWALLPWIQQATVYDFHMDLLEPPFVFGALIALHRRRDGWFWFCCIALWCTKEDTFLYTSVLAVYAAVFERRRALGAALLFVGLVQAAVVLGWYVPSMRVPADGEHFSTVGTSEGYAFVARYSHLGGSLSEVVGTVLLNPWYSVWHVLSGTRLTSVLALILSFGGLAIAGRGRAILLLPAMEMLLANPGLMSEFRFYYGAVIFPFAAGAAVEGARALLQRDGATAQNFRHPAVLASLLIGVTLTTTLLHPSSVWSRNRMHPSWVHTPRNAAIDAALAEIPAGVRVSATGYLAVQVQPGRDVRMLPYGLAEAEYLAVDLMAPAWPSSADEVQDLVVRELRAGRWDVLASGDAWLLMRRRSEQGDAMSIAEANQLVRTLVMEAERVETTHHTGRAVRRNDASNGAALRIRGDDARGPGHVLYGPYRTPAPGPATAVFVLGYDDALLRRAADDAEIAAVDFACRGNVLGSRVLNARELREAGGGLREFTFDVEVASSNRACELRVWYNGHGTLWVDRAELRERVAVE